MRSCFRKMPIFIVHILEKEQAAAKWRAAFSARE